MENEILERNKLIAEFMGLEIITDGISWFDTSYKALGKYNSSWDSLMPVIDKITSMNAYIKYKDHSSSQFSDGGIYINTKFIDNTHNDVVEFIKWYNTQER